MADFYATYPFSNSGGGGGGVTSLNAITGAVTLVPGTGISITPSGSNLTIATTGSGSGSVTSVALALPGTLFSISGSPVTTSGTLTGSFINQNANTFFAGPNGTSGIPVFRAIVSADIPTLNQNTTGTASNITATSNSTLITLSALSLPYSQLTGTPSSITALTGDVTATGPGSAAATLATVNSNVGTFGSSNSIPTFTVNGKGLITAASSSVVIAPAGTLTGTILNATVVTSSLTSVGVITSGVWNGTPIAIANGGTGQTTQVAAFEALSPLTTAGDLLFENATPQPTRLPIGTAGQVLTVVSGLPAWQTTGGTGTVTSVAMTVPAFLSVSGSPITTSGTLAVSLSGTALPIANGGTGSITQNFVDLTTNESIAGNKTFTGTTTDTGNTLIANATASKATIGIVGSTALHSINGGVQYTTRTITSNLTVDTTFTDYIIFCNQSAPITITLPAPTAGRQITIKDISGTASTNNITIAQNATEKIEGIAASKIIQNDFNSTTLTSDGTNWWMT